MPLRGRLEEKGPSDALPLFPVCARRGLADSRGAVKQSVWHKVTSTVICMFQAVIPSLWLTGPAGPIGNVHSRITPVSSVPRVRKQKACATAAHCSESNWSSDQHPQCASALIPVSAHRYACGYMCTCMHVYPPRSTHTHKQICTLTYSKLNTQAWLRACRIVK